VGVVEDVGRGRVTGATGADGGDRRRWQRAMRDTWTPRVRSFGRVTRVGDRRVPSRDGRAVIGGVRSGRVRLMQEEGLKARVRRRFTCTTMSDHDPPVAANVLNQDFTADAPNQRWVGDTSEFIVGSSGKLYLAAILDLFSRFVVGWAVSASNNRHLVIKALDMALKRRGPDAGLLHHSDQGSPLRERRLPGDPGGTRHHLVCRVDARAAGERRPVECFECIPTARAADFSLRPSRLRFCCPLIPAEIPRGRSSTPTLL